MKKQNIPTFSDSICNTRVRKIKKIFFTQINSILNWEAISKEIDKHYSKGKCVMIDCYYLRCEMVSFRSGKI